MSLFNSVAIECPVCKTANAFELAASVNADRRPDLRDEILAGTFQALRCGQCGARLKPPPAMTYIDVGRHQWILVQPFAQLEQWQAFEEQARAVFERTFGAAAPLAAQAMGKALDVRIAFGWPALREKIRCRELGLDDVALELLKMAVLRNVSGAPVSDDAELRLLGAEDGMLELGWVRGEEEAVVASLKVPRDVYDHVAADRGAWQPLRDQLSGRPFADYNRFLVEPAAPAPRPDPGAAP
ncbi:CpXC domain-containing protein [Arenibaculum pallidiluteum]|uniref:CpXC domain-containing protein n=1 Tax=Arenibaculum pallidiluteum TaxID=2812559 RepID=UPI001A969DEF|nr:CpXC domain-containing protein [Arenibaculum pallidiluteum]